MWIHLPEPIHSNTFKNTINADFAEFNREKKCVVLNMAVGCITNVKIYSNKCEEHLHQLQVISIFKSRTRHTVFTLQNA